MIFPDFSRGTVTKRDAFRECKKMLHQRGVKFALQYPAMLRIDTKEGPRRFVNLTTAMDFIRKSYTHHPEPMTDHSFLYGRGFSSFFFSFLT